MEYYGENGIINKANEAKNKTEESNNNEINLINEASNQINNYVNNTSSEENVTKVDGAVIPNGFYHIKDTSVEYGLVISSIEDDDLNNTKRGNQFVWIPVNSKEDWKRNFTYSAGYNATEETTIDGTLPEGITVDTILKYGGFYIARFEAGKPAGAVSGTTPPISQKNATVWINISKDDCKKSSQTMYNNESVISGLITGTGWDVTCNYIATRGERKNISDSSIWGNYSNNQNTVGYMTVTGKDNLWKANNIYDLAGNAWEYINETNNTGGSCVARGGYYGKKGSENGVMYRINYQGYASTYYSFRTALYIK